MCIGPTTSNNAQQLFSGIRQSQASGIQPIVQGLTGFGPLQRAVQRGSSGGQQSQQNVPVRQSNLNRSGASLLGGGGR